MTSLSIYSLPNKLLFCFSKMHALCMSFVFIAQSTRVKQQNGKCMQDINPCSILLIQLQLFVHICTDGILTQHKANQKPGVMIELSACQSQPTSQSLANKLVTNCVKMLQSCNQACSLCFYLFCHSYTTQQAITQIIPNCSNIYTTTKAQPQK